MEEVNTKFDVMEEPLIIPKPVMDLFYKQENPYLINLYAFYYYTAKWQKTNQPYCTVEFAAKGTKLSVDVIRKTKQALIKLGLIEEIKGRTGDKKHIKYYIKVKFLWSHKKEIELQTSMVGISTLGDPSMVEINRVDNPTLGDPSMVGFYHGRIPEGNAYSIYNNAYSINNNAYSNISPSANAPGKDIICHETNKGCTDIKKSKCSNKKEIDTIFYQLANKLSSIIKQNINYQHTTKQINDWAKSISKIKTQNKVNPARIEKALNWYELHFGEQYIPDIRSGESLYKKFDNLLAAMKRDTANSNQKVIGKTVVHQNDNAGSTFYHIPNKKYGAVTTMQQDEKGADHGN